MKQNKKKVRINPNHTKQSQAQRDDESRFDDVFIYYAFSRISKRGKERGEQAGSWEVNKVMKSKTGM